MKNKHGFTLVELLAVIVVLAIIALIAIPIVIRTIENSKRGAAIESVSNMVKTAELYFITSDPKYGKINLLDENLSYGGQKPELGEVEVNKDGNSRVYAYINGYCVTKEYDSELYYASKTNKEECNWYGTDNYETKEGTTFTLNNQEVKNYLIYGNSTQETRSGKNLFDYNNLPVIGRAQKQENGYFISSGTNIRFYTSKTLENYIGQTVTISFDLTTSEDGKFSIYQYQNNGIGISFNKIDKQMTANTKQRISATGVVKKLGTVENYSEGDIIVYKDGYTGSFLVNNIQFELGSTATEYEEYGVMPSPEYPSEVKSTGDLITSDNCSTYGNDACDNIGKYVIQVKNSGKNLLKMHIDNWNDTNTNPADVASIDYNKVYYMAGSGYMRSDSSDFLNDLSLTNNHVTFTQGSNLWWGVGFPIKVKPNTEYTISGKRSDGSSKLIYSLYNNIGKFSSYAQITGDINVTDMSLTIKTGTDTETMFIIVAGGTKEKYVDVYDIMVEENTAKTNFEPYQEKVTNIYLDEPLRKIGDYADYIDFENKKVVRKVKELIFTGKEKGWTAVNNGANTTRYYLGNVGAKTPGNNYKTLIKSNYLRTIGVTENSGTDSEYTCLSGGENTGLINLRVSHEIADNSSTALKNWLLDKYNSGIPVKVNYVLENPTEQTIDAPNIEMLEGASTLSINANISPSNVKLTTNK